MGYVYSFFYFLIVLAILGTLLVGYWEIWRTLGLLFGFFNIIFLFLMKMRSRVVKKEIYFYIAFFVFPCIFWIFGGTTFIVWIYISLGVILTTMEKFGIAKFSFRPDRRARRNYDKLVKKKIIPLSWADEVLSIKKSYRPEKLDRITQDFSAMIYSYTPGFLYGILKACERYDRKEELQKEDLYFMAMDSDELLKDENRAKDFSRLAKKYGSDFGAKNMVNKLYIEIKSYFIFMISVLTEKVLDKDDFRNFLSYLDKIAKEDAQRFHAEYKEHAYLKYTLTENPFEEFSRNIFIILKKPSMYLYLRLSAGFASFFIHVVPVIAKGIFEGKVTFGMKKKM